jgi:hypothetical protein
LAIWPKTGLVKTDGTADNQKMKTCLFWSTAGSFSLSAQHATIAAENQII